MMMLPLLLLYKKRLMFDTPDTYTLIQNTNIFYNPQTAIPAANIVVVFVVMPLYMRRVFLARDWRFDL